MAKKNEPALASIDDIKPTMELTEKQLPEIADWKIDEEHVLDVKVKVVSINRSQYSDEKKLRVSATIEKVTTDDDEKDDLLKGMNSVKPQQIREK